MDKLSQIARAIEQKRIKLYKAADRYGLSSTVVLRISQELDDLLNYYNYTLTIAERQRGLSKVRFK